MADQLASATDLAAALQQDIDLSTATVLLEASTAVVQAAAGGQRIVQVVNGTFEMEGPPGLYLTLPQWPVQAVASVAIDGAAITDWKRFGNRLWRRYGWATGNRTVWSAGRVDYVSCDPVLVSGVATTGYPPGDQGLEFGRAAVLAISRAAYGNPGGASSESIDDYRVAYDRAAAALEASPTLKADIRRRYGRRAGMV